jgi:hypothetical protein
MDLEKILKDIDYKISNGKLYELSCKDIANILLSNSSEQKVIKDLVGTVKKRLSKAFDRASEDFFYCERD